MSGAPNSIILVSDGIVAWGLRVEGEIPIPADVIDGTPPMECPYGYRFHLFVTLAFGFPFRWNTLRKKRKTGFIASLR